LRLSSGRLPIINSEWPRATSRRGAPYDLDAQLADAHALLELARDVLEVELDPADVHITSEGHGEFVVDELRFRVRPDLADLTLVRDDGGTFSFGTLSELGNFLAVQDQLEAGTV
jgi:hypothetical protein